MSILGAILVRGASLWESLAGNTDPTRKFLRQIGTGVASDYPDWDILEAEDLPDTGVIPGIYVNPTLEIDAQGRIVAAAENGSALPTTESPFGGSLAWNLPSAFDNSSVSQFSTQNIWEA